MPGGFNDVRLPGASFGIHVYVYTYRYDIYIYTHGYVCTYVHTNIDRTPCLYAVVLMYDAGFLEVLRIDQGVNICTYRSVEG